MKSVRKMKKNQNHQLVDRFIYRPGEFWYVDVCSDLFTPSLLFKSEWLAAFVDSNSRAVLSIC